MGQPPSQPPQGGFGAPQDAHGAPQAAAQGQAPQTPPGQPPQPPQPAPGYGYPQQPGPQSGPYAQPGPYNPQQPPPGPYTPPQSGPYTQPGPYGAGQQPGPYAPQPGPYGSPQPGPYGYPQHPQFPGPPGTPPGGGSQNPFKGRPALVIGAAVAALLVVGGTVFAIGAGDDDKKPVADKSQDAKPSASTPGNPGDGSGDGGEDPENLNEGRQAGEAKVLWYKSGPDAPANGAEAPGMWITDKTAVKAAYKQVFAYDVGDGKPTWDAVSFPQKICAVTPQKTSDDKIVVAYMNGAGSSAKCDQMVELDLNTGKKGWTTKIEESGGLFDSALTVELSLTGDTLMVGRSQSGTGYDVTTGKKKFDVLRYGPSCFPSGFAGGSKLITVASCAVSSDKEHDEVRELDPATGKAKWTRQIPTGWRVERAYSVDPLVLYLTNEDKKQWNVSALTADGSTRSQLDIDESFAPDCGWALLNRDLSGCTGAVAAADTLYLPTEAKSGANEIVAVNLATGKERWRVKSPGDTTMLPLRTDGTNLLAYVEPSYDAGGKVVSIPAGGTSHTPKTLLQNPQGAADVERGFFSKAVDYVDGRFYLSTTRLNGNDQAKEKLMLAYGK